MDIRSYLATHTYAATRPATEPKPVTDGTPDSGPLGALAQDFAATLANGETVAMDAMQGNADPQTLVAALAQTELAVETAVTVRDKVVEAYQEILRMPV